jgi:glycosyl transferase family 2
MDQVHLFAICWNERKMIPYFFRHYNELVDRFFISDNGSTDGSLEMLSGDERVHVEHWDVIGDSFVREACWLNNDFWKQSRGRAQWAFVVDMDEHLFDADLRGHLANCRSNNVTAIKVIGYDMMAETFPTEDRPLWQLITRGIRFIGLDKMAIFSPDAIVETNYQAGRHVCDPMGRVVWERRHPVKLLHYKRLGAEYLISRNQTLFSGLRPGDLAEGLGFHYQAAPAEIVADQERLLGIARRVPGLTGESRPELDMPLEDELRALRESGLFQEQWYLLNYPDVGTAGIDPVEHFCLEGWREGRKPNPLFDPAWYADTYGEVIGDVNPLLDYVMQGERLGRKPGRNFDPTEYRHRHRLANDDSPLGHHLAQTMADQLPADFDPERYLMENPDVAEAGIDPGWHYLNFGRAERRQIVSGSSDSVSGAVPPDFDPNEYLAANPDVAEAGFDALWHYLNHGMAEGRPLRTLPPKPDHGSFAQVQLDGTLRVLPPFGPRHGPTT